MRKNSEFKKIKDIFKDRQPTQKPPSYEWQELALRVINELGIPNFKRNAVFKVCKNNPKVVIEKCLNDTKELCRTGDSWRYFFKLISEYHK